MFVCSYIYTVFWPFEGHHSADGGNEFDTPVLEQRNGIFNPDLSLIYVSPVLFPLQVVYDGLFGANTNNKLLSLTLQFVHHICMV